MGWTDALGLLREAMIQRHQMVVWPSDWRQDRWGANDETGPQVSGRFFVFSKGSQQGLSETVTKSAGGGYKNREGSESGNLDRVIIHNRFQ